MKIKALETLASDMVGDGKRPNVFFVSLGNNGVQLVSRSFQVAYHYWKQLPRDQESTMEDRKYGVICSVEPLEEGKARLIAYDDSNEFLKMYPSYA